MKPAKPMTVKAAKAIIRLATKRASISEKLPEGLTCRHYAGALAKSAFECQLGHFFEARASDVLAGKTGCQVCKAIAKRAKSPLMFTAEELAVVEVLSAQVRIRAETAANDFLAQLETARQVVAHDANTKLVVAYNAKHSRPAPEDQMAEKPSPKKAASKSPNRGRRPATVRPVEDVISVNTAAMLVILGVAINDEMIAKSTAAANLRCLDCGYTWRDAPTNVAKRRDGCPKCAQKVEELECQQCRAKHHYPVAMMRWEAMCKARGILKETLCDLPYVTPEANCLECGELITLARRTAGERSPRYLARLKAAEEAYLKTVETAYAAAKGAASAVARVDFFNPMTLAGKPNRSHRQRMRTKLRTGAVNLPDV